jgi:hypothetical protein
MKNYDYEPYGNRTVITVETIIVKNLNVTKKNVIDVAVQDSFSVKRNLGQNRNNELTNSAQRIGGL